MYDGNSPLSDKGLWVKIRARPGHQHQHDEQTEGPVEPGHDGQTTCVNRFAHWYKKARGDKRVGTCVSPRYASANELIWINQPIPPEI